MGVTHNLKKALTGHPVRVVIAFGLAFVFIWFASPTVPSLLGALPLIVLALFIRCWAGGHLQRDRRLITSGPYAHVRDPFYLGYFLLLCGFAVMANHPVTYAVSAVGLAAFLLYYMPRKVKVEGARLERRFGEEYLTYRRHVPSLVPRLRPYPMRAATRWSFGVFWGRNYEHWLALAVVVLIGLMARRWWWPA